MSRWYFALAMVVAVSTPLGAVAQNNFSGGGGNSSSFSGGGSGTGSTSGQPNTTLLGNNVNVNFNSVFGNSATIAATNTDPFAAYRPTGSGTGSSTGTGVGSAFAGGTGGASGTGARTGTTGLGTAGGLGGATANRGTGLGTAGGGLGGGTLGTGLGANRTGTGTLGGGQRTGTMIGGNFGGNLGSGGFMGGMNNQMNSGTPNIGYQVNFEGKTSTNSAATAANAPFSHVELQQRLASSPGMQGAANLQVLMQGETAILRGQVASGYARSLAAAMIRLEPGVYEVDNQLVVAPPQK